MAQVVILTDFAGEKGFARYAGAYRVATELREAGYTVQVIDHFTSLVKYSIDPLIPLIDKFVGPETLMLGLSTTFFVNVRVPDHRKGLSSYGAYTLGYPIPEKEMLRLFHYTKQRAPGIKIVAGGAKAPYRHMVGVHAYVMGYADTSIVNFVRYLDGKNPFFQYRTVDGGMIVDSDVKASNFDFQHSTLKWHASDLINPGEALPIEIARGCIFRCKFCSYPLNGKKKVDYLKDPQVLYDEFVRNYEQWGTTHYIYADDTHNDSTAKLELLYDKVYSRLPFKINFYTYLRLDLIAAHPEQIELLAASGLRSAFFGIESLNEQTARAVGKGMSPTKVKETLHKVRESWRPQGITTCGGFIIGLPHETEATAREWCDWLVGPDNPLDSLSITNLHLTSDKGSALWFNELEADPAKYGYSFRNDSFDQWVSTTGLSKEIAQGIAVEYMSKVRARNAFVTSFTMPLYLNIGVPLEQMVNQSSREYVNPAELAKKKQELVNAYYAKLIDLPDGK